MFAVLNNRCNFVTTNKGTELFKLQKIKIMTTSELNFANALMTAKEILTKMLAQGLGDAQYLFVVSNMLCDTYNLTQDQSIIILEEALKIA
jgi:hypothetical protein